MESDAIDWTEKIDKVATRISNMGLETPAIIFLEAHRPLTFFANQGLIFLAPILYPLFGGKTEEAAKFFERGQRAEAAGKSGVAKIYYQMAARRATGDLREQVAAKLEAIGRAKTASKIAQNRP